LLGSHGGPLLKHNDWPCAAGLGHLAG
jgi:hypothetical protein